MATFIVLTNFTDQGARSIKDSPKRAQAFKNLAKKLGANVKQIYYTLGRYDIVSVVEAPDVATITSVCLSVGALGNVRTQTLQAFSVEEMTDMIGKMA